MGDIAQRLYDPQGRGTLIDMQRAGLSAAFARTAELIQSSDAPIFEAGFCAAGALAFADVMLPMTLRGKRVWRMVEVKSSTSVKDYHRDDVAVQAFVARAAGVPLQTIALAHIDSAWVYPGGGNYRGLLVEHDLTLEAFGRSAEVQDWIQKGHEVLASIAPPAIKTGSQCHQPYACGFQAHCGHDAVAPIHPVHWLPYIGAKAQALADQGITELAEVPDALLNERQLRVKTHTLANSVFFDAAGAAADLAAHALPAYFLDFETAQFAVPLWAGTRPYQQNCFQFSLHKLSRSGALTHHEFLDTSGADPAMAFAQALIAACGKRGPVFVYNAGFECNRMRDLAQRHPATASGLQAIIDRVVNLLPIARKRYYHPSQEGSWSIKKLLPAVVPELSYDDLDGVQDGGMAMQAFAEAINPDTTPVRKTQIAQQLRAYCQLDTYAMVRLWQVFAGRGDLTLKI